MNHISVKIYTDKDNYVSNRIPHFDNSFVSSIFNNIHRSKNTIITKKNVKHIEYYYDLMDDEFYLIKYDKLQNINRKIRISHYGFYKTLYNNLVNNMS